MWAFFVVLFFLAPPAHAAIPRTLAFQGKLADAQGQPQEGSVTVTFRLYDAATGGTKLWEESQTVQVANGLFGTTLGQLVPLTLAFDRPYWLESQVGVMVLTPRQPLTATPYALQAQTADRARSVDGLAIVDGRVGIGTSNPQAQLHLDQAGATTTGIFVRRAPGASEALMDFQDHTNYSIFKVTRNGNLVVGAYSKVGIGTTTPTAKLHIDQGDPANTGIFVRRAPGATADLLDFQDHANYSIFRVMGNGNVVVGASSRVGIGTTNPQHTLDVEGYVQAHGYHTGDIVFHKDKKPVWRMYEDEKGLYVESLTTKKRYRLIMEELD